MVKSWLACTLTLLLIACGGQDSTRDSLTAPPTGTAPQPVPPSVIPPASQRWSDPVSWPSGKVPVEGEAVTLRAGLNLLLDVSPPRLGSLSIPVGSALVFADTVDLKLSADWIMLEGTLTVGSESQPFKHHASIILTDATPGENVMGMGDRVLGVMGGTLDLHGQPVTPWTRLAQTAGAGTSTLVLQTAPGWQSGDQLALASTDFDPAQSEEVTVTAVSGTTITLSQPLKYTHWGQAENIGGQTVSEQAEVGLLSHNVVIQGGETGVSDGFGGHVMVMKGSTARIESTEFNRMGQRNVMKRYPLHFHLMGSAKGSYLRASSLHDLYNRCVTVHGSSDLELKQNVAYNTSGHCFFLEDGSETGNSLVGNLAIRVRRADVKLGEKPLLASDSQPAGFWITNPANTVRGNVSAGSDGFGFWYALPEHPTGLSAATGGSIWPRRTPLGEFRDNTAHSGGTGLNVDKGPKADGSTTEAAEYTPVQTPADERSASVQAVYNNFSAYKNRIRGVWLRGQGLLINGGVLADNAIGATFAADQAGIQDTLLVGETANLGTPASGEPKGAEGRSLPQPWNPSFPIRGFEFYDGLVTAQNLSLAGYFPNTLRVASGLGYNRKNEFELNPGNSAGGLRWLDASNKVYLETPEAGRDGDSAATFLDSDGTVTGTAGQSVVASNPLLTPGCGRQAAWNAWVCAGPFVRFWMNAVSGERPGTVKVSGAGGALTLVGVPEDYTTYSTTLAAGGRYTVNLAAPRHLQIGMDHVLPGQSLRLDLPYSGTPTLYRDWQADRQHALTQVVASKLDAATEEAYAFENGVLSVKLMVRPGNTTATLDICGSADCL